jgi:hypothetical protein
MFKKGLDYTVHDSKIDQNGRYIILDISLFDQRLTFVSLTSFVFLTLEKRPLTFIERTITVLSISKI